MIKANLTDRRHRAVQIHQRETQRSLKFLPRLPSCSGRPLLQLPKLSFGFRLVEGILPQSFKLHPPFLIKVFMLEQHGKANFKFAL